MGNSCSRIVVGKKLWESCCGRDAVGELLWESCCGTAAVGDLLWENCCGRSREGPAQCRTPHFQHTNAAQWLRTGCCIHKVSSSTPREKQFGARGGTGSRRAKWRNTDFEHTSVAQWLRIGCCIHKVSSSNPREGQIGIQMDQQGSTVEQQWSSWGPMKPAVDQPGPSNNAIACLQLLWLNQETSPALLPTPWSLRGKHGRPIWPSMRS